jgi:hypothetical protein
MPLLNTRAGKRRDRASAALMTEETRQLRGRRRSARIAGRDQAAIGRPWYRQPTVGLAIAVYREQRHQV